MAIKGARPNEARVAPHMLVSDGERAIVLYATVFGATVLYQSPLPGGNGIHAQIRIAESTLLITTAGASSENAHPGVGSPESLGGTSTILELYVDDVDAVYQRAVNAGATAVMPLMDTFFGDRYGQLRDPFGHVWGLATVREELTAEDVEERMKQHMGGQHGYLGGTGVSACRGRLSYVTSKPAVIPREAGSTPATGRDARPTVRVSI